MLSQTLVRLKTSDLKITNKRMKRQDTDQEKIFANHISEKEIGFGVYKRNLLNIKICNPVKNATFF